VNPHCGDGFIDAGEVCDDGNVVSADGCNATCSAIEDVFFSEYVEGSSNNKALEIRNPFNAQYDLALHNCSVRTYFNGSLSSTNTSLTGQIAANDVYVFCNSSANATILGVCDQTAGSGTAVTFNGDDAIELFCDGVTKDIIGQIGLDPGSEWGSLLDSTADNTLLRKCGISSGDTVGNNTFLPSTQWGGFANDTFSGLGATTCF